MFTLTYVVDTEITQANFGTAQKCVGFGRRPICVDNIVMQLRNCKLNCVFLNREYNTNEDNVT
jgi:hypothetical protein